MPTVLFEQCVQIYDAMQQDSEEYLETLPAEGEEAVYKYKGMLTKLFVKTGNNKTTNYSRIINMLKSMGCIEQVRRGAGSAESIWLLWKRPTEELYEWVKETEATQDDPDNSVHGSSLEQRYRDLQQGFLELRELVVGYEDRISVLEEAMDEVLGIE